MSFKHWEIILSGFEWLTNIYNITKKIGDKNNYFHVNIIIRYIYTDNQIIKNKNIHIIQVIEVFIK